MFIKKDSRKLSDIVADPGDDRAHLKLARRGPEFRGDTRALFTAENAPQFARTRYLSLYNNKLVSVNGLSTLASGGSPLEDLVISNNRLTALPTSLGALAPSLRRLYCEDNALKGPIPSCVLRLVQLRVLRLSGNQFTELPEGIGAFTELEELALEGNALVSLPSGLGSLKRLKTLLLRGNRLQALPDALGGCAELQVLAVSSNDLRYVPASLGGCTKLSNLSLNGNKSLAILPAELAQCTALQRCVLAHCALAALPLPLVHAWAKALPQGVVAAAHAQAAAEGADAGGGGPAPLQKLTLILQGNPLLDGAKAERAEGWGSQPKK